MLRALHFPDMAEFRRKAWPGSFHISGDDGGARRLHYVCPCGCGEVDILRIGKGLKPDTFPSWRWNGSTSEPTLEPSVNRTGHFHGWLRDGYWEAAG